MLGEQLVFWQKSCKFVWIDRRFNGSVDREEQPPRFAAPRLSELPQWVRFESRGRRESFHPDRNHRLGQYTKLKRRSLHQPECNLLNPASGIIAVDQPGHSLSLRLIAESDSQMGSHKQKTPGLS